MANSWSCTLPPGHDGPCKPGRWMGWRLVWHMLFGWLGSGPKLRRYAVTVMDSWTPMRLFWTLEGAKRFYRERRTCANVFKWRDGEWQWMCGARDLGDGR